MGSRYMELKSLGLLFVTFVCSHFQDTHEDRAVANLRRTSLSPCPNTDGGGGGPGHNQAKYEPFKFLAICSLFI